MSVVCGPQEPEALAVIEGRARQLDVPFLLAGREIDVGGARPEEPPGLVFDLRTPQGRRRGLRLGLLGAHQAVNAAMAVAAAELAAERGGLLLSDDSVREGLARVEAPARVEVIPGTPILVLDAAHNPASTRALAEALRFHFGDRRVVLLFGMAGDKDVAGTLRQILPLARAVVATTNLSPRSVEPEEVVRLAREGGCAEVYAESDVPKALTLARGLCQPGEMLVVTGSFYLAGAVRPMLLERR